MGGWKNEHEAFEKSGGSFTGGFSRSRDDSRPPQPQPAAQTVKINFPTAGASGALYAVGAAITNMWNNNVPGVQAASQASAGGIANLNMVSDGEAQVSIAISSNVYQCLNGTDSFKDHPYKDLNVNAHFTAAGLKFPDDIQAEYITFTDAADMLQNGSIDGAWIMSGAPASAVTQALTGGAHLVDIDDQLVKELKAKYPWYASYTIKAGTYPIPRRLKWLCSPAGICRKMWCII